MNKYFNDGWARNTGARLCNSDFLFFIDSDIKLRDGGALLRRTPPDARICYRGNIPGGYGTCLVSRDKFNAVNGYSERMWSWGGEDLDLYIRLKVEQACEIETFFPNELLEHIHHDDALRIKYRLQHWDDLKAGADIQRLEGVRWTVGDTQQPVLVSVCNPKTGTVIERLL